MIDTLVVLGASGDLAGRLLLPAVAALRASGELGAGFRFVGAAHQDWTAGEFADHVRARLAAHAPFLAAADRDALVAAVQYRRADVTDPADVAAVLALAGTGPVSVYLALPTRLMRAATQAVLACGLPSGSRIAIEKPFGDDAASAAELNAALAGLDPSAVYRVDHVLAMTAVQQLPRAGRPGTDQTIEWSSGDIEQLDLLFDETLALEGRASFYDRAGALRDVMQNHIVQVLCTLAAPAGGAAGPAERRAAVLRTVRPLDSADVRTRTRRARYTAGRLADGRPVPDYTAEDGVDPARDTETFAEVVVELDSAQWSGTRFVLRAGKALDARRRGVLVHFRDGTTAWLDLDASDDEPAGAEPTAYQRIVADLLGGGTSYAVGAAETELAWRVFTPVLAGWAAGDVPMLTYPAGTSGP